MPLITAFKIGIHYSTKASEEFLEMMKTDYGMHTMTTTYKLGNNQAQHLYEKVGFTQTDIIDENNCHKVNMIYQS